MIVLGTHNNHKKIEVAKVLAPWGLTLENLTNYPSAIDVAETGTTFAQNACQKAGEQAKHLGMWVIGEDSGLEVDALAGRPGVYSARYSGEGASDARNNEKLLEELAGVPEEKRTARYVCHLALSDPQGSIRAQAEAYCQGRIRTEARGQNGFGYDPLFEIIEYHRTFGELSPELKACISHRARALRLFAPLIAAAIADTTE